MTDLLACKIEEMTEAEKAELIARLLSRVELLEAAVGQLIRKSRDD